MRSRLANPGISTANRKPLESRARLVFDRLEERRLLSGATFAHPGVLESEADFARMRVELNAGAQPWAAGWNALISDGYSQANAAPRPLTTVIRGGTGQNFDQMVIDMQRTYQMAVRWKVSGDTRFADQAVTYLNAWSSTMTALGGNSDRFLASGLYGFGWAAAADIMRGYSGWARADVASFQNYLVNIYVPMEQDFLAHHNTAAITNYWANWDLANVEGLMAIGIFTDRHDLYDAAMTYLYTGGGNGSMDKMVYFMHPGNLAQWQESGRDQGHSVLGMQLFGHIAQMAWQQGDDLYAYNNYQFAAAAEYIAKYNLGDDVPFESYEWGTGQSGTWSIQPGISGASRGDLDVGYELIYAHYHDLLGMAMPYSQQRIAARGTEWRGSGDEFGFGTLTYRLEPVTTGLAPKLTARERGNGQIELDWYGTSNATGYNVYRAASANGTYVQVASDVTDLLTFTDFKRSGGVCYYKVRGITSSGETSDSNIVSATATNQLQTDLTFDEGAGTAAADATGNGHTGTLMNGAAFAAGKSATSVSLSGDNDYVSLPVGTMAGMNDFTINTWVYLNDSRTWSRIFDFGDARGRYMMLTPRNGGGVVEFSTSTVYDYNKQWVVGSAALPTNQWVNVAVTLQDRLCTLYVNGVAVGSNANMDFAPVQFASTPNNWLGRSQFSADPYLNGKIDDFQISRGAMTAGEIYTLATGNVPPAAPASPAVSAAAVPGNQINLSWTSVAGATTGYIVRRSTSPGGPYSIIAKTNATSYADTARTAGVRYYYLVTSTNNGGDSANPTEVSAVALPPMPGVPASLAAEATSSTTIVLNWAAASDAGSYSVQRALVSGGPYVTIVSGLTATTFTDTGLTPGIVYYYVVVATNPSGTSVNSAEASDTPSDLRARLPFNDGAGASAVDVSGNAFDGTLINGPIWSSTGKLAGAIDLDGTDDYVGLPSGVVDHLSDVTLAAWVNPDVVGTWMRIFDFGTSASNYMFLSPRGGSNVVRFAIRTPSVPEQQIDGAAALPTGVWSHLAVTLSGGIGILYVNGVEVGRNSAMTLDPSSLGNTTQNYLGKSQFAADPYLNGRVDDFRIYCRALTASEVNTLATTTAPAVPTGLSATPEDGQVALSWSAVTGASSYLVKRSDRSGGPYITIASDVAGTTFRDTGLPNGITYFYTVAAVSVVDTSSNSTESSATPHAPNLPPVVASPAWSAQGPVGGSTTTLSVVGDDDGGPANLIYTWSVTGTPPGSVTFSTNGANAASSTSATFGAPGLYQLSVTMTDAEGLSAVSSMTVAVALPGDATLDGKVNFADLLILAKNYGHSSTAWTSGDFTGDGNVDFDDLLLLAKNYGQSVPMLASFSEAPLVPAQPAATDRRRTRSRASSATSVV